MTIIVPADCKECQEVIKYAGLHKGPMYIRIPRSNVADIFDEKYHFNINKAVIVEEGTDIALFTNGETLYESIVASRELKKEGISVKVINVPVVKPIDVSTVVESANSTKFCITVENHSIIGGLGSTICETLASRTLRKVFMIGIHDEFGQSGKAEELIEYYGLDSKSLVKRIRTLYNKNKEEA